MVCPDGGWDGWGLLRVLMLSESEFWTNEQYLRDFGGHTGEQMEALFLFSFELVGLFNVPVDYLTRLWYCES